MFLTSGVNPAKKNSIAITITINPIIRINTLFPLSPKKFKTLTKDKNGNIRALALERNADYFKQSPYIQELNFKFYGDFEAPSNHQHFYCVSKNRDFWLFSSFLVGMLLTYFFKKFINWLFTDYKDL